MGFPSTLNEGTHKSQPLLEGNATHPKDSGRNIQPLYRDLTSITSDEGTAKTTPWTGANYQVDETQSTRLRYRSLTKNKGKTSFEVDPDTEPLQEVLAAGEDIDEDPQVSKEVRTPSPNQDQPKPSHEQHEEVAVSYADLKASIKEYYDENVAHRDQTDKPVETTMSTNDRSSTTIKDLYQGLNISTNTTEVLSLVKDFNFSTLQSTVKDLQAHALKQEEASATWAKSSTNMAWNLGSRMTAIEISQTALKSKVSSLKQDTSKIKSMMTKIYQSFKGQSSSAPSSSLTPTLLIMSSATSAVTYTSVYTDSEPGRAFWGADDEEVSEGGIPRVIILGYDGLPLQPVAPPSPNYIPGPENPQTPPVPQDEDEHEFLAEEQPLPGHVTESDPEEDPEEHEDDETEDGPVDYPMDGGDDGDDDDGDSSRDDANDEDEDDEDEEEEEEHLAPADSTTVIPVDEPVFPPEGTEPVIPPPSTDITIGARITVRPQTSISLPPEAEVERLLTMTTPSPSPPISLSPPSAGERLARCTAPHAHSPPLPPSSGCLTQIQTLRIASTQALIDAVTAALPPPPLPPLPPSLYIPPPVDRRDDIPESEQPPRKRLYLSTLGICLKYMWFFG
ncbi:hypothetical protein Tco_1202487 [Tanacetum coccineum]